MKVKKNHHTLRTQDQIHAAQGKGFKSVLYRIYSIILYLILIYRADLKLGDQGVFILNWVVQITRAHGVW